MTKMLVDLMQGQASVRVLRVITGQRAHDNDTGRKQLVVELDIDCAMHRMQVQAPSEDVQLPGTLKQHPLAKQICLAVKSAADLAWNGILPIGVHAEHWPAALQRQA